MSKKILITVAATFFACSCSAVDRVASGSGVHVNAERSADSVLVEIGAEGRASVTLYNPRSLAAMPKDPGIVLLVKDSSGNEIGRCATINPSYDSGDFSRVSVGGGRVVSMEFDISSLARQYCLKSGAYSISVVLRQPSGEYRSNEIDFEVVRP